jgi:hypothetical protein
MTRVRRLTTALVLAGFMAFGIAAVEAAGKKPPNDPQAAICAYLLEIINYPNVNVYIKAWATALYNTLGCQPAL